MGKKRALEALKDELQSSIDLLIIDAATRCHNDRKTCDCPPHWQARMHQQTLDAVNRIQDLHPEVGDTTPAPGTSGAPADPRQAQRIG